MRNNHENFRQAALRHWQDANILEDHRRIANADQLYGLAAECAVKSALQDLPHYRADHGGLRDDYKTHIDALIGKVPLQNLQKPYPTLVVLLKNSDHFSDWHVNQRYGCDGAIAPETLQKHKNADSVAIFRET